MGKLMRNPLVFIAGIGAFAFGAVHFARLAIIPRIPGAKGS